MQHDSDSAIEKTPPVPDYLENRYWWAYVRPWAVWFFERGWLVNLILWGQYRRLRDAVLGVFSDSPLGRTLQIACCYGDLTCHLHKRVTTYGGRLDVIDVLPLQLNNLRLKLPKDSGVNFMAMDSADLKIPDAAYDRALLFFLLHEQPQDVREKTLSEAIRIVKPGGTLVIVDFGIPEKWHPVRYLWLPIQKYLEPFAPDLWSKDVSTWLPHGGAGLNISRASYFGGLYQRLVIRK